jgi:hypothetical protein
MRGRVDHPTVDRSNAIDRVTSSIVFYICVSRAQDLFQSGRLARVCGLVPSAERLLVAKLHWGSHHLPRPRFQRTALHITAPHLALNVDLFTQICRA